MQNIYEQIDSNKRRSWLIITLFIAFVCAFGYFLSYIYGYDWTFLVVAVLISGVGSWISYYNSDTIALSLAGAHPVTHKTHSVYTNIVENLASVARIPKPKIYVIDSPALNAFATGRDPEHGAIAVTQGLIDSLTRIELEGVVAHELSHIRNYDTRLMTIVVILVGSIAMILNWSWRLSWHRGGDRDNNREGNAIIMIIGLVFIILAPIIASLIQMAISPPANSPTPAPPPTANLNGASPRTKISSSRPPTPPPPISISTTPSPLRLTVRGWPSFSLPTPPLSIELKR
jgi:heat shock protein HtpX